MRKLLKFLAYIGLSLIGLGILGIGVVLYLFSRSLEPMTDISQYPKIISELTPGLPGGKLFPRSIPKQAIKPKMYYLPGFLQGATILQLRMQLPPEEIKNLQSKYRKAAKRRYIPGGENNSPRKTTTPDGVEIAFEYHSYVGEKAGENFQSDYEILALEDTRGAPKYDWNHSDLYGVAINTSKSEIIYWLEDW